MLTMIVVLKIIKRTNDQSDYYLPCINAINCARSMIKVVKEGINPILNQFDYSDIGVVQE